MARCLRSLLLLLASAGAVAQFDQLTKLTASDATAGDCFGRAVSLSGDTALVGSVDDDNGDDSGSAYIFQRNQDGPNAWGLVAKLTATDAAKFDYFGLSVSLSGDTALVGACEDDDAGYRSGSAYIFQRNQGGSNAWGQVAKLTASDSTKLDTFGHAVSLSGDTALVGALKDDDNGDDSGSAYIFQRNQGGPNAWGQVAKLTASDAAAGDWFGDAVSLSGDTALVGARRHDDAGSGSGSAYIFERNQAGTNAWGQVAKLTASDAVAWDVFGIAVSLSGDTALVGARWHDDNVDDVGSAYIFQRNQGGPNAWGQVVQLTASDAEQWDNFGWAVSLSGDIALVGAHGNDDRGLSSGSAYIFKRNHGGPNAWGQVAKLTASDGAADDSFGRAVSLSGDTALVGAYRDDDAGGDSGSAYIYSVVPTTAPTNSPTTAPAVTPTAAPFIAPTAVPTATPTDSPTDSPTGSPTSSPTEEGETRSPTSSPSSSPTSSPIEDVETRSPSSSPTVDSETTAAPTAAEEAAGLGVGAIVGIAAGAVAALAATAFFVRKQSKPASPATYDAETGKVASVASDNPGYGL